MNKQSARNFGIGLTNILLEGAWPDKVQAAIVQARKALETGDEQELWRACTDAASYTDDAVTTYFARIAARAAADSAAYVAAHAADSATCSYTCHGEYACYNARQAMPDQTARIDALAIEHGGCDRMIHGPCTTSH